ncbi:hypothetical protein GCM10009733_105950 [Nonomuraea maheshkhaliensis]|uniref:Uncharacterized protein n=1 Tax=Nonomuraea maheshkhaliensis TaxID=419590 RepID=A0ABP4TSZ8_9ACTN
MSNAMASPQFLACRNRRGRGFAVRRLTRNITSSILLAGVILFPTASAYADTTPLSRQQASSGYSYMGPWLSQWACEDRRAFYSRIYNTAPCFHWSAPSPGWYFYFW